MSHISAGFMAMPEPEPERTPQHQPDEDWDYDEKDDPARPERVGQAAPEVQRKQRRRTRKFLVMMKLPTRDYNADKLAISKAVRPIFRRSRSTLLTTEWREGTFQFKHNGRTVTRKCPVGVFRVSGLESDLEEVAAKIERLQPGVVLLEHRKSQMAALSSPATKRRSTRRSSGL